MKAQVRINGKWKEFTFRDRLEMNQYREGLFKGLPFRVKPTPPNGCKANALTQRIVYQMKR